MAKLKKMLSYQLQIQFFERFSLQIQSYIQIVRLLLYMFMYMYTNQHCYVQWGQAPSDIFKFSIE